MTDTSSLLEALKPLTDRVRTDVTAVRMEDGSSRWVEQPLTTERLRAHLAGELGRGVSQIPAESSVTRVAVLDLDSHGGETGWFEMTVVAARCCRALSLAQGLEPTVFRSSGGRGIHIYLLWDTPQDAYSVRQLLVDTLAGLGFANGAGGVSAGQIEVFPKQDEVRAVPGVDGRKGKKGYGNQAILPFFAKSELLVEDELSGGMVGRGRRAPDWAMSCDVPVLERPVRASASASAVAASPVEAGGGEGAPLWRQALDAIPNDGKDTALDYDEWFKLVAAIHQETEGSAEGFAIALGWSARNPKHDTLPGFFEERVWPYLNSDGKRGAGGGTIMRWAAARHGWSEPVIPFGPVPDPDEGSNHHLDGADRRLTVRRHPDDRAAEAQRDASTPADRRGLPKARHVTTDLANANRIVNAYGTSVLVVAGKWHVWDGKVWRADESDVYRFGAKLGALIKAEAAELRKRASALGPDVAQIGKTEELAKALEKWSVKSEMKGSIEAALGLAKKMLTVEASEMDAHPWLLNCRNGVVDLRTGELAAHDPGLFMTKLVDVDFDPDADSTEWERVVLEIARDPHVAAFLRRWFGYCATGDVREQVFVVHWGDGANGKSTMLDTVARVLGPYAGVTAPGLIASGGNKASERHPTELADLRGLRLAVSHESRDGAVLTEDVVKAITGGDVIKARYMREDFFQFMPTHKVQLLTNSKPSVRGTDHGIWRRVCLVPYTARFGAAEEVQAGRATAVRDLGLVTRLGAPEVLRGVLAWIVRGAVEWATCGGLHAPAAVLEASAAYKQSQDRVGQFVVECCEVGGSVDAETGEWVPYEEPMVVGALGLYPTYSAWCKDSGTFPLARPKFAVELERVVPGLRFKEIHKKVGGSGARRKVTMAVGIHIPE